ncbi:TetR/AcrR family transcriptional regulator [Nocardia terpenica]|uniref:TetR family transcriptional regulator n=1 Tax=Nocardia terpenica TaxID=455432 RepID=A0A6G9Z8K8_9NOCA|nr:TetR family transcriptional regulator [Nocardia terpenica]QIS21822.1 TetR family transcriptional regulator [Nocardia terpenica]
MAYDSSATKERILVAAATEFAEYGVAGARIDRIAATAQANKRALYDYFGDKDALFAAVLERQMTDCAESVPLDGSDPGEYASQLLDYHAAHPELLRLLLWEALEFGDRPVPAEESRAAKYRKRADAIADAQTGPTDSRLLLFFILGLVNWGAAAPQLRRMVLGDDFPRDRFRDAIADAVRALAKN